MNNDSQFNSSRPNIDDATLDRHLESLPGFDPFAGFEDRVMSRVLVPLPLWVQSMKRSVRSLVETRRFRWIAAGLMATSTLSLVVATTFVLSNLSTWRALVGLASESARDVFAFSAPLSVSRDMALIAAAAAGGFLVFSALMLVCLMRPKCLAGSE